MTDDISTRKVLLYSEGMTLKVLKQEEHAPFLAKLKNVTKIRIASTGVETSIFEGDWMPMEDQDLVAFITAEEERLELADLPVDVKSDYTLASLIPVTKAK